jgi:hypothetical protein
MLKATIMPLSALAIAAFATTACAEEPMSDAAYMAKIATAAPDAIVKGATIVAMEKDGTMRTLQKGTNDFTCMTIPDGTPMCADPAAMEWMHALMHKAAPPDKVGFMYMLAGDVGTSNAAPGATGPTADNHWIKTGPHVMILGPAVKTMAGYSRELDPDPAKPYVMWGDTPYEHLMIPVK